ncbi:RNA polymerase sigma factor [Pedobacter sp. MW01-1-1]|uniref:RNA polymerase sigma factor n=1 Tax=Pedobacter sp. MW01-1-1 TaxID=3383027 RepID=UPI003FF11A1B
MLVNGVEEEHKLISDIVAGSERAFSILFLKYIPALQSFALRFTKSEADAEEIIQDAFVRIWLNRDKLEHVENVKAYLYKYVSNECLSYIRKKTREEKVVSLLKERQAESDNVTMDVVLINEINNIVSDIVLKLPNQRRKIYQLSRIEGKTIPEIAEILQISPNTVKNTLVTVLKTIRENLDKHGIVLILSILLKLR